MQGRRTKAYLERLVKEKKIPYMDILVQREHEPILRHFISLNGQATGKERLFLYSATKPMTVACALSLIEEGRLSLDDEVSKYLPAYANTFLEGGAPTKNKMTVRHLFTMSGGLSYNVNTPAVQKLLKETDGKADTVSLVQAFVKEPLLFEPGERFEYSLCHDVLAAVVEVVAKKRFSEVMQERVFSPLGMSNTGFHTQNDAPMERQYLADKSGKIVEMECENFLVLSETYDSGGAGAIGCVEDYAKFADAMACGGVGANGARILKEETVALMRSNTQGSAGVESTFTCVQGELYGYGLGVRTRKYATDWGLPVGEFGWDGAAGMYLLADPEHKISVVVGMHVRGWPYVINGEHLRLTQCAYEDMKEEGLL